MLSDKGKALLAIGAISPCGVALAAEADLRKQIDEVESALPTFAIPMREVGDRFQNIYFAAKDGNWALAAYMSKYMNGSMKPPADVGIDYAVTSEPGGVPK